MSIPIDALFRHGATFILAGSALLGVGKIINDYLSNPYRKQLLEEKAKTAKDTVSKTTLQEVAHGAAKLIRVTALPASCILVAWKLCNEPDAITSVVPALFSNYSNAAVSKIAPIYARNMTEAFELGQIYRDHNKAKQADDADAVQQCLQRATALLKNAGNVSSAQLEALPRVLGDLDNKKGPMQRLLGVLSIANIIQTVATVVLTGTVVPFFAYIFGDKIILLFQNIVQHILIPLHHLLEPTYEPLCYVVTALTAIESARYPRNDQLSRAGVSTAFTSIAMFCLSWAYTTSNISSGGGSFHSWMALTAPMFTAFVAPLAVLHQSKFLGYLSAFGAVASLGFTAFSYGLCLVVGFDTREDMERCVTGCAMLSIAMAAAKANNVQSRFLVPFEGPVSTVSTSVFFLGLTILAESKGRHLQFIGSAAGYIAAGEVLGMTGMSNAAKTWSCIYLFSRFCLMTSQNGGGIVTLFGGALIMYVGARFLQRNPQYITAAIFGTDARQ